MKNKDEFRRTVMEKAERYESEKKCGGKRSENPSCFVRSVSRYLLPYISAPH